MVQPSCFFWSQHFALLVGIFFGMSAIAPITAFSEQNHQQGLVRVQKPLAPSQLIEPSGTISAAQPVFAWNASSGATAYTLRLVSPKSTSVVKMTDASLGCATGGVCGVRLTSALQANMAYNWSVMASNSAGDSPYSGIKSFRVVFGKDGKILPGRQR